MMPKSSDVILLCVLFQAGVQPGQLFVILNDNDDNDDNVDDTVTLYPQN